MKQNLRLTAMLWPLLRLFAPRLLRSTGPKSTSQHIYVGSIGRITSRLIWRSAGRLGDRSQTAAVTLAVSGRSARGHSAVFRQRTPNETAGIPHEGPTKMRSRLGADIPKGKPYMETCFRPPSLTLPSGPIPMCPAYTSVKNPKSDRLANSKRLHSGRKGDTAKHEMGWGYAGGRLETASVLSANSEPTRTALVLAGAVRVRFKSNRSAVQVQSDLRSQSEEYPEMGWSVVRSSAIPNWFEYGKAIVRQLLGFASPLSRSVVEGFSKPTRTIVEALSKDCRTSLEQQSNTRRRNPEESCVWTHAMAPARNGLGLALGLMVTLFLPIMCLEARAQAPDFQSGPAVTVLNKTLIEGMVRSASTNMPIEGAKVHLLQSDTVVFTDANGNFSLATARKEGEVEASFAGYMPVRKPFDENGIDASASTFRLPTDVNAIDKLLLGDTIPGSLWDLPLTVVNHPKGRHTVTLREYQDRKLIVLDFWARWCSPCVKSVDYWGQAQKEFSNELAVITVHIDFPDRALPFMQNRGWQVPAVVGIPGDYLNAYFHRTRQVGSVIWIYQGRFYAAPKDKKYPIAELRKLLNGDPIGDIPSTATYLHTTK